MSLTVTVLGATGSIGRSTTDLLAQHADRFRVGALVGGRDAAALAKLALEMKPDFAALADESAGPALAEALSGSGIPNGAGESAVLEAVAREADIVVAAVSGAAGRLSANRSTTWRWPPRSLTTSCWRSMTRSSGSKHSTRRRRGWSSCVTSGG